MKLFALVLLLISAAVSAQEKDKSDDAKKDKTVLGVLSLIDENCVPLNIMPNFGAVEALESKRLKEYEKVKNENRFIAYYGQETTLSLTAIDDQDEITVGDNGTVIVDDNRAQSSSIVIEMPLSRLFGRKNHINLQKYEIDKTINNERTVHHTSMIEKYLSFKSSAEKLKYTIAGGMVRHSGSYKDIVSLRKEAVLYFSHSDPTSACSSAWLGSTFTPTLKE